MATNKMSVDNVRTVQQRIAWTIEKKKIILDPHNGRKLSARVHLSPYVYNKHAQNKLTTYRLADDAIYNSQSDLWHASLDTGISPLAFLTTDEVLSIVNNADNRTVISEEKSEATIVKKGQQRQKKNYLRPEFLHEIIAKKHDVSALRVRVLSSKQTPRSVARQHKLPSTTATGKLVTYALMPEPWLPHVVRHEMLTGDSCVFATIKNGRYNVVSNKGRYSSMYGAGYIHATYNETVLAVPEDKLSDNLKDKGYGIILQAIIYKGSNNVFYCKLITPRLKVKKVKGTAKAKATQDTSKKKAKAKTPVKAKTSKQATIFDATQDTTQDASNMTQDEQNVFSALHDMYANMSISITRVAYKGKAQDGNAIYEVFEGNNSLGRITLHNAVEYA